jgi:predicted dehydrogenase
VLEEGRIAAWKLVDSRPDEEDALTSLETQDGRSFSDPTALSHVPHQRQIEDLLEAIDQDREPRVNGEEALKAVEIIRAIYLSAQRGKIIRLPLTGVDA